MSRKMKQESQAKRAVRMGLIITSWAFVLLGFILTYNA